MSQAPLKADAKNTTKQDPAPSTALAIRVRTPDEIILDEHFGGGMSPSDAVKFLTPDQCKWIYGHPAGHESKIAFCPDQAVKNSLCQMHYDKSLDQRAKRGYPYPARPHTPMAHLSRKR